MFSIRRRTHAMAVMLGATLLLSVTGALAQEGADTPIRTSPAGEFQVSKSEGYLAWSQNTRRRPNHYDVFVKPDGATRFKVNPRGTNGTMGSLDGSRLIFQQWTRFRSNLKLMDLATRRVTGVRVNTKHWEFWPRLDGNRVLFARRMNRTGRQRLILANLSARGSRRLVSVGERAYLFPGQINGDFVVWSQIRPGRAARVKRFQISTGTTVTVPNDGLHNWGPSVTDQGTVYFGRSGTRCGRRTGLYRWEPGTEAVQVVDFPDGIDMGQSFVHTTAEGKIHVVHNRADCERLSVGSDLYEFIDPFTVTLTVAKDGNRTGTVTGPSIACGTDCTQDFEPGTQVTLTATPDEGARFGGWSEQACGDQPTCTITITADTTITATFRP